MNLSNNDDDNNVPAPSVNGSNLQLIEDRRAPEGKDNDSIEEVGSIKENSYTTDVNGKGKLIQCFYFKTS